MIQIHRKIPTESLRLLLWDLDGTLVDSMLDLASSINALRKHLRLEPLPIETIQGYVGNGARALVQASLGGNGFDVDEALAFFLAHYEKHLLDHTQAYPGIPELLKACPLPMAVLTNKPLMASKAILSGLGLAKYFAGIYGGDSFPHRKPHPHGALTLMETFRVKPKEVLMIGDSENDLLAAKNANLWFLGVTYGYDAGALKRAKPHVTVDSAGEIAGFLRLAASKTKKI